MDRYPADIVPKGTVEHVFTTHVADLHHFFVQMERQSSILDTITEKLADCYTDLSPHDMMLYNKKLGSLCAAKFTDDNSWYRAKITGLMNNGLIEVFFVDYGNTDYVSEDRIKAISAELVNFPVQSYKCSLANVSCSQSFWTPEQIIQFEDRVMDKRCRAVFVSKDELNDLYHLQMYDAEGNNINQIFGAVNMNEEEDDDGGAVLQNGFHVGDSFKFMSLELGSKFQATVVNLNSPGLFWCQDAAYSSDILILSEELSRLHMTQEIRPLKSVTSGTVCAAKFSEDEAWYRGIVQSVSGNKAQVYFVDYGNMETVDLNVVCNLKQEMRRLPVLGIKCCLANISHNNHNHGGAGGEWLPSVTHKFEELAVDKEFEVKVVGRDGDIYRVTLLDIVENKDVGTQLQQIINLRSDASVQGKLSPAAAAAAVSAPPPGRSPASAATSGIGPSFEVGSKVSVTLSWVESPGDFWVQLDESRHLVEQLFEQLQEVYGQQQQQQQQQQPLARPSPGAFVVAKYSEDGMWYRGVVLKHLEDGTVHVLFIDYGNSDIVQESQLRQVSTAFGQIVPLSFRCSLAGVKPLRTGDRSWTTDAKEFLEKFTENGCLCEVLRGTDVGKIVRLQVGNNNQDVAKLLLETGVVVVADVSSQQAGSRQQVVVADHSNGGSTTNRQQADVGDYSRGGSTTNRQQADVSDYSRGGSTTNRQQADVGDYSRGGTTTTKAAERQTDLAPPAPIPAGSSVQVYTSSVVSPSKFFLQLAGIDAELDTLMDRISQVYLSHSPPVTITSPHIGQPCAALYSEDSQWYRGTIVDVKGNMCSVLFVDYGNEEIVELKSIRVLPTHLAQHSIMAYQCSLAGIQAATTCWSESAKSCFQSLVMDQLLDCCFLTATSVELSCAGQNVADELVRAGHCRLASSSTSRQTAGRAQEEAPRLTGGVGLDNRSSNSTGRHRDGEHVRDTAFQGGKGDRSMQESAGGGQESGGKGDRFERESDWSGRAGGRSDKFGSDGGGQSDRFGGDGGGRSDRFGGGERSDRFGSDGGRSLRFGAGGRSDRFGDGERSDRFGGGGRSDRFGGGGRSDRFGDGERSDRFGSEGGGRSDRFGREGDWPKREGGRGDRKVRSDSVGSGSDTDFTYAEPPSEPEPALLVHVDDSGTFYLQLLSMEQEILVMCKRLSGSYKGGSGGRRLRDTPSKGSVCCAKFSDGNMYRARVEDVQGDIAVLRYVDYGNTGECSVYDLKFLFPDLLKEPVQAFPCVLRGYSWSMEQAEQFVTATLDKDLTVNFTSNSCPYEVDISTPDGDLLCLLTGTSAPAAQKLPPKPSGFGTSPKSGSPGSKCTNRATSGGFGEKPSSVGFEEKSGSQPSVSQALPKQVFPSMCAPRGTHAAFISHIGEDGYFFLQLARDTPVLDSISEKIQAVADTRHPDPAPGSACAAVFSQDSSWYRALITSRTGDQLALVFVDFGNGDSVVAGSVRPLSQELLSIAPVAYQCQFTDTGPLSCQARSRMAEYLMEQEVQVTFQGESAPFNVNVTTCSGEDLEEIVCPLKEYRSRAVPSQVMPAQVSYIHDDDGSIFIQLYQEHENLRVLQEELASICETSGVMSDIQSQKVDSDVESLKVESDIESQKVESDIQSEKVESDIQSQKVESDIQSEKVETDIQSEKVESDIQSLKVDSGVESLKVESDIEAQKVESDIQSEKVESDVQSLQVESDVQSLQVESGVQSLQVGQPCCLKSGEELLWHRGRVIKITDECVEVLLVDSGKTVVARSDCVKSLPSKFLKVPPFALECRLKGVDTWTEDLRAKFVGMTQDKILNATFYSREAPYRVSLARSIELDLLGLSAPLPDSPEKKPFNVVTAESLSALTPDSPEKKPLNVVSAEGGLATFDLQQASPSSHAELRQPCPAYYVSHVEVVDGTFYVQTVDKEEDLNDLADNLTILMTEAVSLSQVCVGDVVCGRFTEDDSWYRAKVECCQEDGKYQIRFVDYGNVDHVSSQRLAALPESVGLSAVPPFAVRCRLSDVVAVTPEQVQQFQKMVADQTLGVIFRVEKGGFHHVDVYVDGESVTQKLGLSPVPDVSITNMEEDGVEEDGLSVEKTQDKPHVNETDESVDKTDLLQQPDEPASHECLAVSPDERVSVTVSWVHSPDKMYIQLNDQIISLNEMMDDLADFFSASSSSQEMQQEVEEAFVAGDVCAALFEEDGSWYRARVCHVTEEGACQIVYIDYGNTEVADKNNLRQLPDKFKTVPAWTIEARLAGVSPVGDGWTQEVVQELKSLVENKSVLADILHVDQKDRKCVVQLLDLGILVHEVLISKGFAVATEEISLSKNIQQVFSDNITADCCFNSEETAGQSVDAEYSAGLVGSQSNRCQLNGGSVPDSDSSMSHVDPSGSVLNVDPIRTVLDGDPGSSLLNDAVIMDPSGSRLDVDLVGSVLDDDSSSFLLNDAPVADGEELSGCMESSQDERTVSASSISVCEEKMGARPWCVLGDTAEVRAYVSHSVNPSEFYCQLSSATDTLTEISATVAAATRVPAAGDRLEPGEAVVGLFHEDQQLYRARVLDVRPGTDVVRVRFIDYGNECEMSPDQLFTFDDSLTSWPAQAVCCCLNNTQSLQETWSAETCAKFSEIVTDHELLLKLLGTGQGGRYVVDAVLEETGQSVQSLLVEAGLATAGHADMSEGMRAADFSDVDAAGVSTAGHAYTTEVMRAVDLSDVDALDLTQPIMESTVMMSDTTDSKIPLVSYEETDEGHFRCVRLSQHTEYDVVVSNDELPSLFHVQLQEMRGQYQSLMTEIAKHVIVMSDSPGFVPCPDQPCLVQHCGTWYRGLVTGQEPTSWNVKCVDSGWHVNVSLADMKELPAHFRDLPAQAVSCYLAGVVSMEMEWPTDAITFFMDSVRDSKLCLYVLETADDGKYGVYLSDPHSTSSRSLNRAMLDLGYAEVVPGSNMEVEIEIEKTLDTDMMQDLEESFNEVSLLKLNTSDMDEEEADHPSLTADTAGDDHPQETYEESDICKSSKTKMDKNLYQLIHILPDSEDSKTQTAGPAPAVTGAGEFNVAQAVDRIDKMGCGDHFPEECLSVVYEEPDSLGCAAEDGGDDVSATKSSDGCGKDRLGCSAGDGGDDVVSVSKSGDGCGEDRLGCADGGDDVSATKICESNTVDVDVKSVACGRDQHLFDVGSTGHENNDDGGNKMVENKNSTSHHINDNDREVVRDHDDSGGDNVVKDETSTSQHADEGDINHNGGGGDSYHQNDEGNIQKTGRSLPAQVSPHVTCTGDSGDNNSSSSRMMMQVETEEVVELTENEQTGGGGK